MNRRELLRQGIIAWIITDLLTFIIFLLDMIIKEPRGLMSSSFFIFEGLIVVTFLGLGLLFFHKGVAAGFTFTGVYELSQFFYKFGYKSFELPLSLLLLAIAGYVFYRQHRQCCMNLKSEKVKIGSDNTMYKKVMTGVLVILASIGFYFAHFSYHVYSSDIWTEIQAKDEEFFKKYEKAYKESREIISKEISDEAKYIADINWEKSDINQLMMNKVNKRINEINKESLISFISLNLSACLALYLGIVFLNPLIGSGYLIVSLMIESFAMSFSVLK
jgi:hypothetical protein